MTDLSWSLFILIFNRNFQEGDDGHQRITKSEVDWGREVSNPRCSVWDTKTLSIWPPGIVVSSWLFCIIGCKLLLVLLLMLLQSCYKYCINSTRIIQT